MASKEELIMAAPEGDFGSTELYASWLTLEEGPYIEDGTSKHIDFIDEANVIENRGEASSSSDDGSNKRVKGREESFFPGHIPEEILTMIFCKLPLHTLFQMQIVSTSWQSTIFGSAYFHNLWEQCNVHRWLMMELYDETGGSSNGLVFYDVNRRQRYKKIFNEEWRCSDSQWCLRAGDGGLLVYSCKTNGNLQVVNPLTMQSHYLEDIRLNMKTKLSYYIKNYNDDVAVHLNCDPKTNTYQVTLIIGNLYLVKSKEFVVLIYKSVNKRWEIRGAPFENRWSDDYMPISLCTSIFMQNQKIYWVSKDGRYVFVCDLNGDSNIKYLWVPLTRQGLLHQILGILMYKGRVIMVCNGETRYPNALIFYEIDELGKIWRFKYELAVPPKILFPGITCVKEDYIWVIQEGMEYGSLIICIDIDSGELKIRPTKDYPFMLTATKWLSMPPTFFPCSEIFLNQIWQLAI